MSFIVKNVYPTGFTNSFNDLFWEVKITLKTQIEAFKSNLLSFSLYYTVIDKTRVLLD